MNKKELEQKADKIAKEIDKLSDKKLLLELCELVMGIVQYLRKQR